MMSPSPARGVAFPVRSTTVSGFPTLRSMTVMPAALPVDTDSLLKMAT